MVQDQMAKDFGGAFVKSHPEANAVFDVTFLVSNIKEILTNNLITVSFTGWRQGQAKEEAVRSASHSGSSQPRLSRDALWHLHCLWFATGDITISKELRELEAGA